MTTEYLRRNQSVANADGAKANSEAALKRLRGIKNPPKWLIASLEGIVERTLPISAELALYRDMAPDRPSYAGSAAAKNNNKKKDNVMSGPTACTRPNANTPSESCKCRPQEMLIRPAFYAASRASNLDRPRMWANMRDNQGYRIISTWIDTALAGDSPPLNVLWPRIVDEVSRCDCLVLYVEPDDFPLKGAFVEVGVALAFNKPVLIVANGVDVDPVDCRPLGSWAKHPLVRFVPTVEEALAGFRK